VIENCASGGMRTDYALLSRLQLHSTSDQQEYLRYPPIAAAAPAAIAPEQAAVWAYPQPEFTAAEIAFTMVTAMLGRVHLSGHLDLMSAPQRELVAQAVRAYKESLRPVIAAAVPFWPLGLPRWDAPVVALGLRAPGTSLVAVWRREPVAEAGTAELSLPVPHLRGAQAGVELVYPRDARSAARWDPGSGTLAVTLPGPPSACVLRIDS
jgi:alpha-galactosidase